MSKFAIVDAKSATQRIPVSIALSGGAGSGKTWSALMIATELADGGKVGMVDTENGRGLEYRDFYDYRYLMLDAPYSPDRYEEAIQDLIEDGCTAIVVDSGSHAWEQEGGILESVNEFCQEKAERNRKSPETYNAQAWAKFRPIHRHMIHFASRNSVPTVWCFRAREKTKVERVNGKIEFIPQGWQPITSDLASFEVSLFAMLQPPLEENCQPGTVMRCKVTKSLEGIVKPGQRITKQMAKAIADYAKLKSSKPQKPTQAPSASDKPPEHTDTENGSPRSEGAAVAEQLGIQHDPPEWVEDDPDQLELTDEEAVARAKHICEQAKRTETMDKINDLSSMAVDLKGRVPADNYTFMVGLIQKRADQIHAASKAA